MEYIKFFVNDLKPTMKKKLVGVIKNKTKKKNKNKIFVFYNILPINNSKCKALNVFKNFFNWDQKNNSQKNY